MTDFDINIGKIYPVYSMLDASHKGYAYNVSN